MNRKSHISHCLFCGKPGLEHRGKAFVCKACGKIFFFNTAIGAGAIIRDDQGRVLFIKRGKEPAAGKLDVPGGFIDYNETIEDGLRREVAEELGLQVKSMRYIGSFPNQYMFEDLEYQVVDAFFECEIADFGTLRLSDEVKEIIFRHPAEIVLDEIAFPSMRRLVPMMVIGAKNG